VEEEEEYEEEEVDEEEEEEDEKEQGVENVVKAWSVFRVFPIACSPHSGRTNM